MFVMELQKFVHLFQEIGMLAKTPRSGFAFLGSGKQSVAEHSYRMAMIAFSLAECGGFEIDKKKLLLMCLMHDFPEARTGDHNYINKRYVSTNTRQLHQDIAKGLPLGGLFVELIEEYDNKTSVEAVLAHDADQLELLLVLKEEHDLGNKSALHWFDRVVERVSTPLGKSFAEKIRETPYDSWWHA